MRAQNKKRKSPSRERYEKANPTFSVRLPIATRDKLLAMLDSLKTSRSEACKVLVGELELKAKPIEEARNEGFQAGFQQGKRNYLVTFPCSECGKSIPITELKTKAEVARFMSESGWKHSHCP